MGHAAGLLLIAFHSVRGVGERRIAQRRDNAILPVEVLGSHAGSRVLEVLRGRIHVREERDQCVERVGTIGNPLDCAVGLRTVRTDLHDRQLALTVDANRAVHMPGVFVAQMPVRIERRALIMRAEHVFHVLDGDLALRLAGPRDVVAFRRMIRVLAVPHLVIRVEETLHVPCARRVVHVVGIRMGSERVTRVERRGRFDGEVEMVVLDELGKIGGAHMALLIFQSVVQIELVNAQLVRHGHIRLIRHALGDPVMPADRFQPPDLMRIGEGDTVHLICAKLLKQRAETLHAFASGFDVRQHEGQEIFLTDAARGFRLVAVLTGLAFGRGEFNKRVGAEHAFVGGQRFGGAHRHVRLVDARFAPDTFLGVGVRHGCVLQRIVRKINFDVAEHTAVMPRLFARANDDETLRIEFAVGGILVAGDDGRAVIARVLTYQNRGAGHGVPFSFAEFPSLRAYPSVRPRMGSRHLTRESRD